MGPRVAALLIAVAVVVLDRMTKLVVRAGVSPWDTIPVIPGFFNIVHTENPGVAFGMLAGAHGAWRGLLLVAVSAIVLALIGYLVLRPLPRGQRVNWLIRTALALILGGAAGNLYDRIVHGAVTDFVEVYAGSHYFPAFNVADSAITVGAALLILDMIREHRRVQESTR